MNSTDTQNINDLSIICHVRLGMRVLSRIFQLFVAWPAAFAATCVLAIGVAGESPALVLTDTAFEWAEDTFRGAPVGAINLYAYEGPKTLDISSLPSIEQHFHHVSTVSVGQGKAEFSEALTNWYWRLVWLSGLFMFMVKGWRYFLVIPAALSEGSKRP